MRTIWGAFALLLCLAVTVRADVVFLKNGDRLSGTLVDARNANITLKSEVLGTLRIPLSNVQSFSVSEPVVVVTESRESLEGQIEFTSDGNWNLTRDGRSEVIEVEDLTLAMPSTPYRSALEGSSKPWRLWNGSFNIGYNIQNGDQKTNTMSTFVSAVRQLPDTLAVSGNNWRTNYNLVMLFSGASQNGVSVSSNTISSSLRQDYLFSPKDFVFAFGQFDHIESQGLDLRRTIGSGFGRDLIRTNRTVLSTLGSLNYEHHKLTTGISEGSAEVRLGQTLGWQLMDRVRLEHTLNYYQNVFNANKQRADASANLGFQINSHLSLNAGVVDLYLSHPAEGRRRNNFIFTTGVGFKFNH
jgi:putative salt-induced outer membrane protein YdiY